VDERRAQLIALGRRLFAERPYDAISIDDIAEAAGVSKGLLYHYFEGKHGFYVETVRAGFQEMTDATEPDPALSPIEQLDASLDAYLDYVERHGEEYRNIVQSGVGADPEVSALVEAQRQVVIARILRALGLDSPEPAIRMAVRGWLGFIDAASIDWLTHRDVPREAVRGMLSSSLQAALLTAAQVDPALGGGLLDGDSSLAEASQKVALAIASTSGLEPSQPSNTPMGSSQRSRSAGT
jgi:AcrR family transcriptional regulator